MGGSKREKKRSRVPRTKTPPAFRVGRRDRKNLKKGKRHSQGDKTVHGDLQAGGPKRACAPSRATRVIKRHSDNAADTCIRETTSQEKRSGEGESLRGWPYQPNGKRAL